MLNWSNFLYAFASRGFVSDSWAFLLVLFSASLILAVRQRILLKSGTQSLSWCNLWTVIFPQKFLGKIEKMPLVPTFWSLWLWNRSKFLHTWDSYGTSRGCPTRKIFDLNNPFHFPPLTQLVLLHGNFRFFLQFSKDDPHSLHQTFMVNVRCFTCVFLFAELREIELQYFLWSWSERKSQIECSLVWRLESRKNFEKKRKQTGSSTMNSLY